MAVKRLSGGARLARSGKRPILLGVTAEQYDEISRAASADGRPMTQFLIFHGLRAAKKILKKSPFSC